MKTLNGSIMNWLGVLLIVLTMGLGKDALAQEMGFKIKVKATCICYHIETKEVFQRYEITGSSIDEVKTACEEGSTGNIQCSITGGEQEPVR